MSSLRNIYTNIYTQATFTSPEPKDEEKIYDGSAMITETDLEGIVTFANRKFLQFTGFDKKEFVGLPHSVIRHPDMPKGLFYAMWKIIKQKRVWRGYIKSLCKDGSYFWALVYIQPKLNDKGEVVGYVANRRDAYPRSIEEVSEQYAKLQGVEHMYDPYFMNMELYHGDDLATFHGR